MCDKFWYFAAEEITSMFKEVCFLTQEADISYHGSGFIILAKHTQYFMD